MKEREELKKQIDENRKLLAEATPEQLRMMFKELNNCMMDLYLTDSNSMDSELRKNLIVAFHDRLLFENWLIDRIEKCRT